MYGLIFTQAEFEAQRSLRTQNEQLRQELRAATVAAQSVKRPLELTSMLQTLSEIDSNLQKIQPAPPEFAEYVSVLADCQRMYVFERIL